MTSLTLTGVLASTDPNERLRLNFVDRIGGKHDASWARLQKAVPPGGGRVPYVFPFKGAPDDAGIRGECWITVPGGRGREAQQRRRRVLALAVELRGREVTATVTAKRYAFVVKAGPNRGKREAGTSLQLKTLELWDPN